MAAAHSDLLLVLHVSQLHVLRLGGGRGLLQVAADHELVHEDATNGTQEWRDDGYPPPVPAGPGGKTPGIREAGRRKGEGALGKAESGLYSRKDF